MATPPQPPLPYRPPAKRNRWGLAIGISILVMTIVAPLGFVLPIVAPQPTCDLLAPIMGCKNDAAPKCWRVSKQARRGTTSTVAVECPEGGGSASPIWTVGGVCVGVAALQFVVVLAFFIASSVKRTRADRLGPLAR